MIELEQVSKRFGARWALRDLDLRVAGGEIFGLLGHNGAGKSTSIGILLGQVWATSGAARVCGCDVVRDRARALRHVGAIFETPAFDDDLSGWRNLEILCQYAGPTPRARLDEVLEWVGLGGRARYKVRTYSHGMRARLALAQALLPAPRLLILDEPTEGLDPEGIHEMRQTILRLHRELGLTILLSSHLLYEVEQLCTRIAVLKDGRKIFDGSLAQAKVQRHWVRLLTADFPAAAAELKRAGLIEETLHDAWLAPVAGVGNERLVRHLVGAGFPVFEIAPVERTLEGFYLELMGGTAAGREARAVA
jgi:ABC-2 type transport system ATP-binding protein